MFRSLLILAFAFTSGVLRGQVDTTSIQKIPPSSKIYNAHPQWEIPVGIAAILAESVGVKSVQRYATLHEADVLELNPETINAFDRPGAYYDPSGFPDAKNKGDLLMSLCVASPVLLMLDKKIRRDWSDMLGMILVTHSIDNAFFLSAVWGVRRPRPVAYNPAVEMEAKIGQGKTNAFFSGHVAWSAASTFFIAKVYTDYHHIKGVKRLLIFTGAAIPPSIVAYYRVHSGDHFNTDVLTGLVIGAACGILVPEMHRFKNKNKNFSFQPFYKLGSSGVTLSYTIK